MLPQGTEPPECQVVQAAGEAARGGTAYLNLECGDCHGEPAAVDALVAAGVARVVVGLRHPLPHLRGAAIAQLRAAGVAVQVLGEAPCSATPAEAEAALDACLAANEALLHRAVCRRPLGLLKYAMTLDGKIATHTGHSAWVSSPASRERVFETRARSDAVIVGGCTGGWVRWLGEVGYLWLLDRLKFFTKPNHCELAKSAQKIGFWDSIGPKHTQCLGSAERRAAAPPPG